MRKLGVSRDVDLIKMYTGGVEFRCGRPFHRRGAVAPGFLASIPLASLESASIPA